MRTQLEHLVKGNLEFTKSADIAGIRQLGHLFNAYRAGEQSVEDAAQEVVARDTLFLSPYIMAALKKWSETSPHTGSLRGAGSLLLVHHEFDRVVPFEQFRAATSTLPPLLSDSFVRKITAAPAGLNLTFRALVSPTKKDGAIYHFNENVLQQ